MSLIVRTHAVILQTDSSMYVNVCTDACTRYVLFVMYNRTWCPHWPKIYKDSEKVLYFLVSYKITRKCRPQTVRQWPELCIIGMWFGQPKLLRSVITTCSKDDDAAATTFHSLQCFPLTSPGPNMHKIVTMPQQKVSPLN
jgi:hypothetical protein